MTGRKLFVMYVPSLDRRRITPEATPHVHALLQRYPRATVRVLPATEQVPTMVTGVLPHEHKLWQVSLKEKLDASLFSAVGDAMPGLVTTTLQCVKHMTDAEYDLPAIPYWRRRQFNLHRMKYTRREADGQGVLEAIGGYPSLFKLIPAGDGGTPGSKYHFVKTFAEMERQASSMAASGAALEFLEFYALDLFTHWNLDRADAMDAQVRVTDRLVSQVHEACRQRGYTFVLLVDHGQERVTRQIDVMRLMRSTGIPRNEYTYFIEIPSMRLWFRTDRARQAILAKLRAEKGLNVLHRTEMHRYGVRFPDDAFGEYYVVCDHGTTFFPHDFYQPIANLYMAMKDPEQKARGLNPIHRGYHGHLPNHPADTGYLCVADETLAATRDEGELVDFAPTMLDLLGVEKPAHMHGSPLVAARQAQAA